MTDDEEQANLDALYAEAAEDNVFFIEFEGMPAAAGDLRDLEALAEASDTTPQDMREKLVSSFMGAIVDLCVLGTAKGEDRVANCQSAWDKFKPLREKEMYPRMIQVRKQLGLPVAETKQLGTF